MAPAPSCSIEKPASHLGGSFSSQWIQQALSLVSQDLLVAADSKAHRHPQLLSDKCGSDALLRVALTSSLLPALWRWRSHMRLIMVLWKLQCHTCKCWQVCRKKLVSLCRAELGMNEYGLVPLVVLLCIWDGMSQKGTGQRVAGLCTVKVSSFPSGRQKKPRSKCEIWTLYAESVVLTWHQVSDVGPELRPLFGLFTGCAAGEQGRCKMDLQRLGQLLILLPWPVPLGHKLTWLSKLPLKSTKAFH